MEMSLEDRNDADELKAGFVLGEYEILAGIGVGGMARVYRAQHRGSGQLVALKVMEPSLLSSTGSRKRFVREGRTASAVKHPNVVRMLEVGSCNDRPYIAMELLSGLDLDSYIRKRGPLPEAEIIAVALPIVAGVAAVHELGVVHRDLKPSNIFLATGAGGMASPKLLDFGISKVHGSLLDTDTRATGSREIIGTPAYLSPEALNGSRELGPMSDQYSLGVVLYECAVGRSPYGGSSLLQLLQSLAAGKVQSPRAARPELSAGLDEVIRRAMMTKPEDRYSDIRELGRALWLLSEEPARAIWATQFGEEGYTPPILGSATAPIGMVESTLAIRQATPLSVSRPTKAIRLRHPIPVIATAIAMAVLAVVVSQAWKAEPVVSVAPTPLPPASSAPSEKQAKAIAPISVKDLVLKEEPAPKVQAVVETLELANRPRTRIKAKRAVTKRSKRRASRRPVLVRTSIRPSPPATEVPKTSLPASAPSPKPTGDSDLLEMFAPTSDSEKSVSSEKRRSGPNGAPILD